MPAVLRRKARADVISVGEASATALLDGTFVLTPDLMPTLDADAFAPTMGALDDRLTDLGLSPGAIDAVVMTHLHPDHTGYRVADGDRELLIWGDIGHTAPTQMANPQAFVANDSDPRQAVETRLRALDMAASDGLLVAGMHRPPGAHRIERAGDGYRLVAAT
ncbi:MBL fold metallo-hydrolase [Jannaschia aquimarina]|uniref:MBL fold metallo-hydrolase n=1 Tax=Jannaschia aquimarina TaxID=935700 RepID=UPI001130F9E0|nr:MBL fold metallo-hydrolase [Jannaschia aquimarina]